VPSFLSFRELCKCAVEHASDNANANLKANVLGCGILGKGKDKCAVEHVFGYNLNLLILRGQLHERFKHSLDSIRAILAEIEACQNLLKLNLGYYNYNYNIRY
jgi:hypothetical protein